MPNILYGFRVFKSKSRNHLAQILLKTGAEPEISNGGLFWGSGGKAPSRRRLGLWGQSPQPPEAQESGGGAPSARKFCFFAKITSF